MADRTTPPTAPTEHSATALLGQGMAHLDALCIAIAEVVEGDSSAICENARAIVADLIDAIEAKRIPGDTASCKLNTAMQLLIGVRALPGNTYTSTALLDIAIPLADALADVHHDMPEPDFAVLATLLLLVGERDVQKTVPATAARTTTPASGPDLPWRPDADRVALAREAIGDAMSIVKALRCAANNESVDCELHNLFEAVHARLEDFHDVAFAALSQYGGTLAELAAMTQSRIGAALIREVGV